VTVGAQQAIALIARTFLGRGDRALVEMPTYPHATESLRLAGARLVPVTVTAASVGSTGSTGSTGSPASTASAASTVWPRAVGDDGPSSDGWDVEAVEESIRRANPALAYLIPDFHNPTGASMSPETRIRILAAAAAQGTIVVGDETTAELDIDRIGERLPIAAYGVREAGDAPVILIGSASKSLWGGLRIGWIRADRPLIRKLIAAKPATDLGTPILEQLVVARMLPHMREIIEERRVQLRAGRESVRRLLAEQFPDWTVPELHGGLAAWVGIGAPVSSALALGARNHNLLIAAGPRFGIDGAFERFLRIPITYAEDETARAITSLSRAWTTSLHTPVPYPDPAALADVV
jgi:DNA-binding transcriptional MocR family regulator